MIWKLLHPHARVEMLGYISMILLDTDPRSVKEQFNDRYAHGGGWFPFQGHTFNEIDLTLSYPGDPPTKVHGY